MIRTYRALFQDLARGREIAEHPLHRARRLRATLRGAWLTFRRRRSNGDLVVPYVGGAVLVWPKGVSSVRKSAEFGLGEYEDMAFCLHALRAGDLFCDIGANAGVYTVLASKAVGARTIAFEPVPATFDVLRKNIVANGIEALVDARQCGLASEPDLLHFTADEGSLNHVVDVAGPNTVDVPVVTFDAALVDDVPTVIKIDVEGFELKVWAGATRTLADPRLLAVLNETSYHVQRFGGTEQALDDLMLANGFQGPFWYDPEHRRLVPAGESGGWRWNHIFVRDRQAVEERLRSSRSYRVHGALV